jgi:hypothetical protein
VLSINMRADLSGLQRALFTLGAEQVPFASAMALTALARGAVGEEKKAVLSTFDSPTPFTQNAFFAVPAKKNNLIAWVKAKDVQASYLEPYVVGGERSLGTKEGMIVPRQVATNRYGNLPRGKLKAVLGKPNVFVGKITFKKTGRTVSGVFERGVTPRGNRRKGGGEYGTKGNNQNAIGGARTTLKMLMQFEDTTEAPKRSPMEARARAYVKANAKAEFMAAMRKAMASARR